MKHLGEVYQGEDFEITVFVFSNSRNKEDLKDDSIWMGILLIGSENPLITRSTEQGNISVEGSTATTTISRTNTLDLDPQDYKIQTFILNQETNRYTMVEESRFTIKRGMNFDA